ncbi:phosphoribosylglycinamide formyltransferase, partial [Tremellales sp. Uapishka_1]
MSPSPRTKRITVLISGSGTNLQALLDAVSTPRLPSAHITYVLSSRSNAYGLTRAQNATPPIPTSICALKTYLNKHPSSTREDYDAEVARLVLASKPDLVVLAGWMHILSDKFLGLLNPESDATVTPIPIINLHPALPQQFDGANAIGRAYEAFQKGEIAKTGVMVHRVVAEVDRGEPLVVREIAMRKGESLEELEARIHEIEHEIIVDGARIVLEQLDQI